MKISLFISFLLCLQVEILENNLQPAQVKNQHTTPMIMQKVPLLPALQTYASTLESEFGQISVERKENLEKISFYIKEKLAKKEAVSLNFICTHNSRRSQFGQVWAMVAAKYYGFDNQQITTFSGGTEATACNPRTVAALQRTGIEVEKINELSAPVTVANNPRYAVVIAAKSTPIYLFSKKYSDAENPQKNFCAVLVCSQADESCPLINGATLRVYHGYEDPKKADGQENESKQYDETCRLIAREMFYVFSKI
jgi:arsenate reductase